ncbi:MAG: site-2 protease family protein [Bradymonadaceae bacterium]|nr:site-2 protease family protein [Lujinxingiaceae bacterium]
MKWHLFTLGGHKVYLEPFFLLLIAVFVFMDLNSAAALPRQLLWAPILFGGVLFHEFGHAVAIKAFGFGPSTIILQGFGGVTINETRQNSKPGESIVISLAGPGASLLLALLSFGGLVAYKSFAGENALLTHFLYFNGVVNVFWAVFNMLPINPMDGGHVVLHALRKFMPMRKALYYSAISSLVVLGLLAATILALGHFGIILIVLIVMFGMQNVQVLQQLKRAC